MTTTPMPSKVLLADVKPLEKNPRIHSEPQIKELQKSLKAFGQYRALVLDETGTILAGNGMYHAMMALGWTEADAVTYKNLSESNKKKLILADNRLAQMGATDHDLVEEFLKSLDDFEVPGYDSESLKELLAGADDALAEAELYGVVDEEFISKAEKASEDLDRAFENPPVHSETIAEAPAEDRAFEVPDSVGAPSGSGHVCVCEVCGMTWR